MKDPAEAAEELVAAVAQATSAAAATAAGPQLPASDSMISLLPSIPRPELTKEFVLELL
jgi:hypothetical protein